MAQVFVSYASEDRERAAQLAAALGAQGWSVWWDRDIVIGQAFDQVIEAELESAGCVVVLWSAHSVTSEWVKNEATAAADRGVLLPAQIDSARLPLAFRSRQTADLCDWHGDGVHAGWQSLCHGIAALLKQPQPIQHTAPAAASRQRLHGLLLAVLAVTLLAAVLGVTVLRPWSEHTPKPRPASTTESVPIVAPAPVTTPADMETGVAVAPSEAPAGEYADLADLVVGSYHGDVVADSRGSSRSDIVVQVKRLDALHVRVTSDYARIGSSEVALSRIDRQIMNAGGDTLFNADLGNSPPSLTLSPRNELTYQGTRLR